MLCHKTNGRKNICGFPEVFQTCLYLLVSGAHRAFRTKTKGFKMTIENRFAKLLKATPDQLASIDSVLDGKELGPTVPSDRKLLTLTAAADVLGVSRQTIWRMVNDGRLPTVELRAGRCRVPSNALTELLQQGGAK